MDVSQRKLEPSRSRFVILLIDQNAKKKGQPKLSYSPINAGELFQVFAVRVPSRIV